MMKTHWGKGLFISGCADLVGILSNRVASAEEFIEKHKQREIDYDIDGPSSLEL